MSRVPPANSTSHIHTPGQTQYNMRMPLNLGGRNIPPSAMRQARSYQTGHHQVTQSRKTHALRCPGVKYADGNSNYHGRGKPKEKPLFERVPKLANVPGTAGEENLAIQDKTSTLKPTTSNRSTRKGSRGYGRAPRVKPSRIIPATVAKHHRLMLTVTCLAYPLPGGYTRLQSASRRRQSNSGIPREFPATKPKRKPQNTEGQHSKSSRSDDF